MYSGVGKSGSPAPKPITGRPAAFMALALASTARVADSAILPTRVETRRAGGVGVMDAMFPDSAHPVGTGQPGSRGSDWVNWTLARTLVALGRPDACPCMPGASFSG